MAHVMSRQLTRYVGMRIRNPVLQIGIARCLGRDIAADAAMDDETVEKLKDFLESKLHPAIMRRPVRLCDGGDPEAQDDLPENAVEGWRCGC